MAFTYFFRDMQILELAVKHVVPYVSGRSRIKIWDAGCAMGPEPYSLAIVFAENMGQFGFKNLLIHASDYDNSNGFGETIAAEVYAEEEVKRIPADILAKYFKPNNRMGYFEISPLIRERLRFQHHDLLSLSPIAQDFSLIICKNVLLHFQYAERIEVIKMFHSALAEGGYFATEHTQKMPPEIAHLFTQVSPDGQLFKKGDGMRVKCLVSDKNVYSSHAYLILGEWNRLEDINTLLDVGSNNGIVSRVAAMATGFGKHAVEQVVLTHSHSDHTAGLASIIERYRPRVYAFAPFEGVDHLLRDGQIIRMGDQDFEVIHAPWHSDDSICLYCAAERVLFSGDTPLHIRTPGGTYLRSFADFLERLCLLQIDVLYTGHDSPVTNDVNGLIAQTLTNVRQSRIMETAGRR